MTGRRRWGRRIVWWTLLALGLCWAGDAGWRWYVWRVAAARPVTPPPALCWLGSEGVLTSAEGGRTVTYPQAASVYSPFTFHRDRLVTATGRLRVAAPTGAVRTLRWTPPPGWTVESLEATTAGVLVNLHEADKAQVALVDLASGVGTLVPDAVAARGSDATPTFAVETPCGTLEWRTGARREPIRWPRDVERAGWDADPAARVVATTSGVLVSCYGPEGRRWRRRYPNALYSIRLAPERRQVWLTELSGAFTVPPVWRMVAYGYDGHLLGTVLNFDDPTFNPHAHPLTPARARSLHAADAWGRAHAPREE